MHCGDALGHVSQSSCGCPIPGSVQSQGGRGFELPGPVSGGGRSAGPLMAAASPNYISRRAARPLRPRPAWKLPVGARGGCWVEDGRSLRRHFVARQREGLCGCPWRVVSDRAVPGACGSWAAAWARTSGERRREGEGRRQEAGSGGGRGESFTF